MSNSIAQLELNFSLPRSIRLLSADDIYKRADEVLLREIFEDRRFEAKPSTYGIQQLGEYFSMWANTSPDGGIIAVGIRNDNEFEGCADLSQKELNRLEKMPMEHCPDAKSESKRVSIRRDKDGKEDYIVLFRVWYHKTRAVKTSQGKYFHRLGDSKVRLTPDQVIALQEEKGEIQFECEDARSLQYPDSFDSKALASFCNHVRTRKGWEESHSIDEILELMRLGRFDQDRVFVPNVACCLLFGKDPRREIPGCRIRFIRFEGEVELTGKQWNAVKDDFIEGTIQEQIAEAAELLQSQLRTFSKLNSDKRFYTTPEYPAEAWYEALVNACVHRSYGNGQGNRTIFIKMFDDRLEIESPGPLPPLVTPKNIYDSHCPRNPFLMDAMFFMEYVRCAHEGTRRIRNTMSESSLPEPEFAQDSTNHSLVRVVLRNNIKQRKVWVDQDVSKLLGDQIASLLSSEQKRCLNYVAEYEEIGVSDAARLLECSWPKAKKVLEELTAGGVLVHDSRPELDRDPKARYRLKRQ